GNLDGARAALLLARDAAADEREPYAWTETQLGKLELSRGRLMAATVHLRSALRTFPGYVYALDALAQVEAARGNLGRAGARERPSIDGDDVLAWALARNGRCGEALHYSRLALRLGTKDSAKLFHRAEIERCLGRDPRPWARRALALNPHFSLLWTPALRRLT